MKLVCSVSVNNRLLSAHSINLKKKFVKATLGICKHPKSDDKYYILLFSGQDKTGSRYDLRENIAKVLTKFVNDGKTTLQFKNPPHDLFIQADVIPLKTFLHLLQRILDGCISPKELSCSSLGMTPVSKKDVAPTKLVILNRSEYPIKGFPRTLESLTISGINRLSLDLGILRLGKLKILDLSNNKLSKLPEEFSKMNSLKTLDISGNEFSKSSLKDWQWLSGNLSRSLQSLNLAKNGLTFLPPYVIKLYNLLILNVNENKLEELPNGIGRLTQLKELRVSHNMIREFPGSMKNLKLVVIDVSNNNPKSSQQELPNNSLPNTLPVCTLKEYAAQSVLNSKLYYDASVIPATLVTFLDYEAKYCICGKPTFSVYLYKFSSLRLHAIAASVITSNSDLNGPHIPINCYCCSRSCLRFCQRNRVPFVR